MMDYVALKLATPPTVEPVSLIEAELHLRVDMSAHDTYIGTLITAAREVVERISGRALIDQTWDMVLDAFPCGDTLELPRPPLKSVTSITYIDAEGVSHTLSASDYQVDTYSEPGRIVLKGGATWPSTTLQAAAGVIVRYVAGYGAEATAVPAHLKQAILLLIGHYYEHAEAVSEVRQLQELPMGVQMLLRLERIQEF